jgi:hypothetical protein
MLVSVLEHHAHGAFAHLGGKLRGLPHGSILQSWSLLDTRGSSLTSFTVSRGLPLHSAWPSSSRRAAVGIRSAKRAMVACESERRRVVRGPDQDHRLREQLEHEGMMSARHIHSLRPPSLSTRANAQALISAPACEQTRKSLFR